jgi:branched-subunit amino acid aminotransferase/4-amino-4-deoxychorismate lyase
MSTPNTMNVIQLNGVAATADDLRLLAANNYGHFTAMRVEQGGVRGLDLHMERLAQGTRELFSSELDRAQVRAWLRQIVGGEQRELAVRITVFSRQFDRAHPAACAAPDVLISAVTAPPRTDHAPLRLNSFRYSRELPHIKHVGTFPLFHYRALAQQAGFDDALFAGDGELVSEASIWNIGFVSGRADAPQIVWPQAPQLDGIGMQLLRTGLAKLGIASRCEPIALADLRRYRAAFVTNANTVARPVACIDERSFAADNATMQLLQRCHESNLLQPL